MKRKFYLLLIWLLVAAGSNAQVTIGSNAEPVKGAILDLKSQAADVNNVTSTTGGLVLPRVQLEAENSVALFFGGTDQSDDVKTLLTGLTVYNLTSTGGFSAGPYNWDGTQWVTFAGAGGTAYVGSSPVTVTGNNIGLITGTANGQVLKWNGTAWVLATDTNTTYTGTAPIAVSAANAISLNDAGVTTVKLADGAVNSAKIADAAVATVDLANNAVTTAKLADNSVTSVKIVDGAVANADLANNAVNSAKIQDGTVALADLADNSVNSAKIVNASIVAADLNAMGATNGQVLKFNGTAWAPAADAQNLTNSTTNTINGTQVQRAALTGDVTAPANSNATTIANNAVTSAKIADGAVATVDLANNAVTTAKLADNSVTSVKIVDGAVANADLANNAVNSAKIQDGTVALADLAANSVNSSKIVDASIVNADIANTTITQGKLIGTGSTAGQVLTSTGAGAAPTWQTPKSSDITGQIVAAGSSAIISNTSALSGTITAIVSGTGVVSTYSVSSTGRTGITGMFLYTGPVTFSGTNSTAGSAHMIIHATTTTTISAGWRVAPY
ncbi:beta strand repeat-containing protein [Dysgonomonas termitidis]|uniref:Beta strand repeat-containing protein n=1 Tax=Dysgonomonas termitidis TaxID=1516126 RepID=A0ABV9L5I6_9BACT